MIVTFEEDYLRELYEDGQASDKKQAIRSIAFSHKSLKNTLMW